MNKVGPLVDLRDLRIRTEVHVLFGGVVGWKKGSCGSSQGQRFRSESPDPNQYSMGTAGQSLLRPHLIQSHLHRLPGPSASCSRISQSLNMVPRFFPVESFMQS